VCDEETGQSFPEPARHHQHHVAHQGRQQSPQDHHLVGGRDRVAGQEHDQDDPDHGERLEHDLHAPGRAVFPDDRQYGACARQQRED